MLYTITPDCEWYQLLYEPIHNVGSIKKPYIVCTVKKAAKSDYLAHNVKQWCSAQCNADDSALAVEEDVDGQFWVASSITLFSPLPLAAPFNMVWIGPNEARLSSVLAMQSCVELSDQAGYNPIIFPPSPGPSVHKLIPGINTNKDPGSDKAKVALLTSSRQGQSAWLLLPPDACLLSGLVACIRRTDLI